MTVFYTVGVIFLQKIVCVVILVLGIAAVQANNIDDLVAKLVELARREQGSYEPGDCTLQRFHN